MLQRDDDAGLSAETDPRRGKLKPISEPDPSDALALIREELRAEFDDDVECEQIVETAFQEFLKGATVKLFIPIMVKRVARERLRARQKISA